METLLFLQRKILYLTYVTCKVILKHSINFIFLFQCSQENLLSRGKAAAAAYEISALSTKLLDYISYFKHFLGAPLEELQEVLEEDDEDAVEALWNEIEDEIAALNAKDEEVILVD